MAASYSSPSEYIAHHLTFLQKPVGEGSFWTINVDTFVMSLLLGFIGLGFLWLVTRNATSGVPSKRQAFVELAVGFVNDQVKSIYHGKSQWVAPIALTVFLWVVLMNSMDFLPVDLLPKIGEMFGLHYMRVVPTADLSVTMGLSVSVLLICLFYNVKIKGFGGWVHELFSAPFGDKFYLYPINFLMQMIEFLAKTVSHGMRLFGNMYAGELVFMLIALMGGTATVFGFLGHIVAGSIWAVFHILIVALQAFIFMMLTLVYIGQAHESH